MMSGYAAPARPPGRGGGLCARGVQANAAFQKKFFKPFSGIYDNGTQTSSVLPLYFDMVPAEYRAAVVKSLTDRIESESHGHVGTGLVGAQWLMRTLSENGRAGHRIPDRHPDRHIPDQGYMVDQGATTVWELWNGDTPTPQ